MVNRYLTIILIFGLISSSSIALADSSGWYVAADVGQSKFTGTGDLRTSATPENNTDTGYRFSAGYQFNSYLGLEAGYANFGQATGTNTYLGNHPLIVPCGASCLLAYDVTANSTLKTHAWTLIVVGTYPLSKYWSISARAGGIDTRSELNTEYTPYSSAGGQPYSRSLTSTNWDGTYGLSLNWLFADHWAARLSWDKYVDLGDSSNMGTYSVNLASLGIIYRF